MMNSTILQRCTWATLLGCLSSAALGGCWGGSPEKAYPVHGSVVWADGRTASELAGATVELQLVDVEQRHTSPHGEIRADGSFDLRSYGKRDGAPQGRYKAIIVPIHPADAEPSTVVRPIDERYSRFATTPLEVVVEATSNEITLQVEPPAK